MAEQIVGYYISRKEKLLKDFETVCTLMRSSLVERYGEEFAGALASEARQQYEELIPDIPYIRGPRAGVLNTFLLISAQELAVYKALAKCGRSAAEAWELCHEALRLRLVDFPQWKRNLMRRFMFSGLMRRIVARRARKKQKLRYPNIFISFHKVKPRKRCCLCQSLHFPPISSLCGVPRTSCSWQALNLFHQIIFP